MLKSFLTGLILIITSLSGYKIGHDKKVDRTRFQSETGDDSELFSEMCTRFITTGSAQMAPDKPVLLAITITEAKGE